MQKQGMKEIKLEIKNEFVMNVMSYFMTEEGYLFVGNEREIWLENLSHPTVQLIYFNQAPIYNEMQEQVLLRIINRVRARVRQRYLLFRLNVLVIEISNHSVYETTLDERYLKVISAKNHEMLQEQDEVTELFPKLKEATLTKTMPELVLELHKNSSQNAQNVQKALTQPKYPPITCAFIAICLIMFIILSIQPDVNAATAILFGAKYNPLIIAGDYYRLFAPAVLHIDFMHLLLNGVFIYQIGRIIEQSFGWWRMIIIMIGSAFLGNILSFGFSTSISLGAATIAYGLLGSIVFLGLEDRKIFMQFVRSFVVPILGLSLVWGVIDQSVDLYGHLGGFLGGFLIASCVGSPKVKHQWQRIVLSLTTFVLVISGTWIRGNRLTDSTDFEDLNAAIIVHFLETEGQDVALDYFEKLNKPQ